MQSTHYRGEIDGDIKEYLIRRHSDGGVCPSFIGYEPFRQLWKMGVITPEITSIRLYIPARHDEHYIVIDENIVEGVELPAHSGQPGLYNIKDLLTKTKADYWEVEGLNPRAFRRI